MLDDLPYDPTTKGLNVAPLALNLQVDSISQRDLCCQCRVNLSDMLFICLALLPPL